MCCDAARESCEQDVNARLQRRNGSPNNDITIMARARLVKVSGIITDRNDFACVA
jgi:hypothetical protein